jgi:hypothetical protein
MSAWGVLDWLIFLLLVAAFTAVEILVKSALRKLRKKETEQKLRYAVRSAKLRLELMLDWNCDNQSLSHVSGLAVHNKQALMLANAYQGYMVVINEETGVPMLVYAKAHSDPKDALFFARPVTEFCERFRPYGPNAEERERELANARSMLAKSVR